MVCTTEIIELSVTQATELGRALRMSIWINHVLNKRINPYVPTLHSGECCGLYNNHFNHMVCSTEIIELSSHRHGNQVSPPSLLRLTEGIGAR